MRIALLLLCAFLLPAAVSGCGGTTRSAGFSPEANSFDARMSNSRMSAAAKSEDLLYVSNYAYGTVTVYSYRGHAWVGQLGTFSSPGSLCVDPSQDVYVPNGYWYDIAEYRHGDGTPIRYLADPNGVPASCAVDPTTGDIAVVNGVSGAGAQYGVLIYRKGRGYPAFYSNAILPYWFFCAYDQNGNLYLDGENGDYTSVWVAVLRKGSASIQPLTLNQQIEFAGGLQ